MSYTASIPSTTGSIASYAKKMVTGKPDMEIVIDGFSADKTYTTFDALTGRVEITAPYEARFDEIQITLEGSAKTFVENLQQHTTRSSTTARHQFLKLNMPIRESDYPQPRIAEAGRTYTFPFNFIVPDQLPSRACSHECTADHVKLAHSQMPPSMGDREVASRDDLAPEMAKVQYAIKVKVSRVRESDCKTVALVEGLQKLLIVPAQAEAPPLSIGNSDKDYAISKTKSLRKGMFSGKLGKITVSSAQPTALVLPSTTITAPATTMATINLRFDPHEASSQPPRLGGLKTQIKALTYFGVRPAKTLSTLSDLQQQFELTRGVYEATTALHSRCVEAVAWTKHAPAPGYTRRDSASSISPSDCSDNSSTPTDTGNNVYYTASILVPITLPASKTWVPTFHICTVSRTYSLLFNLSIHTPGTGVPASSVSLCLPIQIVANGNGDRKASLTAAEAAAELADVDEFLRPRVIEVPREELVGNSVLELPPSYDGLARTITVNNNLLAGF